MRISKEDDFARIASLNLAKKLESTPSTFNTSELFNSVYKNFIVGREDKELLFDEFSSLIIDTYALDKLYQFNNLNPNFDLFNIKSPAKELDGYTYISDGSLDGVVSYFNFRDLDYYFLIRAPDLSIASNRFGYVEYADKLNADIDRLSFKKDNLYGCICFVSPLNNANHNLDKVHSISPRTAFVKLPFSKERLELAFYNLNKESFKLATDKQYNHSKF